MSRLSTCCTYGGVPVPFTASWTGERRFSLSASQDAGGRLAVCQASYQGKGKPDFAKPHMNRQRAAVVQGLCDLCGLPLKGRTKVSLSHARPAPNGAEGLAILQVELLLHKACAATCLRHCPSLKRDVKAGTLIIRQALRYRVQLAILNAAGVELLGLPPSDVAPVGHAKIELLNWVVRSPDWLDRSSA